MATHIVTKDRTVGLRTAQEELCLDATEFELLAQLGEILPVRGPDGRPRVRRSELDRLRAEKGFPDALRERLRTVGATEGAELLGIARERFTRLARSGFLQPVSWYVNRYRAVVWLYLAAELRWYAQTNPALLTGRLPVTLREALDKGADHRARSWRTRRVAQLVRDAEDPWDEAAVWAALLGPAATEAVADPSERNHLRRLRSALPPGNHGPYAAQETIEALVTAADPDEIAFARLSLTDALGRARAARPAPWAAEDPPPPTAGAVEGGRPHGRGWRRLLGMG